MRAMLKNPKVFQGRSADSLSRYFGDPARCPFEQGGSYSSIQFSWRTRTRICIGIGIARGLAILHEEVRPHIIHRDIKASNILLDKGLTPKISDFGLPKLIPANMTHVSTRVAGTIALVVDGCLLVCCRCVAAEFCWAAAAAAMLL